MLALICYVTAVLVSSLVGLALNLELFELRRLKIDLILYYKC